MKSKAIFSWSGGKDSSYCLYKVLTENLFEVCYLLTTVNANFKRVSMHGVREELLDKQADSIGIPLLKVMVSEGTNDEYEKQMEPTQTPSRTSVCKKHLYCGASGGLCGSFLFL